MLDVVSDDIKIKRSLNLENKNLMYNFLSTIFALISFIILIKSIKEGNEVFAYTTCLLYIFPKFIQSVEKVSSLIISKTEFILRLISVICAALVILLSFVGLSITSDIISTYWYVFIVLSVGFVVCDIYYLVISIRKHCNLNNMINEKNKA